MNFPNKLLYVHTFIVAVLLVLMVAGQNANVSSKLDFAEDKNSNGNSTNVNTSIPIASGMKNHEYNNNQSKNYSNDVNKSNTNNKSRPKIHGVRVTVDTGDNQMNKESKESVELVNESGKHTKRVGIHTDITFEIEADGEKINNTTALRNDDDDASVPIFIGRGSTLKPRNSHESKYNWNPNFSAERRSYDSVSRSRPNYYPQYPTNIPISTATQPGGRDYHRSESDGWISYIPSQNYWTTERTYNELYRPNTVPQWKPCYCGNLNRRRRENHKEMDNVEFKLESPFSI